MSDVDVQVQTVETEVTITDSVGPLSPEDVKRLVTLVLQRVRQEQDRAAERERDTGIHDRAYRPPLG
jgi:hypothetical protein